jgi:diguanylate cyclase (GGDEF)-like protein
LELDEKRTRCREIDFLAPLGDPELEELLRLAREVELEPGSMLFDEGDTGDAMYIVLRGHLSILKKGVEIATVGDGSYVGEMAIVESKVRSAAVRATQPTLLLELTEGHFQKYISPNARSLLAITKTLSVRSRNDLAALDSSLRRLEAHSREMEQTNLELQEIREQLMRSNRELERVSTLDQLTGLANRRRFDVALRFEWRRAARDQQPLALLLSDIDRFKDYNDTYGHPAGDEVLVRVAEALGSSFQRAADVVARYGGEEFAVILPSTDAPTATRTAEMLREKVERLRVPHSASPVAPWLTISFGIASIVPRRDQEPDVLVELADRALYAAKQAGRNRVMAGPAARAASRGA